MVSRRTGFYQDITTGKIYRREIGEDKFTPETRPIVVRRGVSYGGGGRKTSGLPPIQTPQVTVKKPTPTQDQPQTTRETPTISAGEVTRRRLEQQRIAEIQRQLYSQRNGTRRSYTPPEVDKGFIERVKQGYRDFQEQISERIPTLEEQREATGRVKDIGDFGLVPNFDKEKYLEAMESGQKRSKEYPIIKQARSFLEGAYGQVQEKPVDTAAMVGIGAGLSASLGIVGAGSSKVLGATATKFIGSGVGGGLLGAYGFFKGGEIAQAEDKFKKVGEITAGEIIPFGVGGRIGSKGATKVIDYIRTFGRKEVPTSERVLPDVLSGKKRFVESGSYGYRGGAGTKKQQFDLKVFEKEGKGFHATPENFFKRQMEIGKGASEFEGLYIAPSPSTYFLRSGGQGSSKFGVNVFGGAADRPAVAEIYTKFGIAKASPTGKGGKAGSYKFTGKIDPETAYVTGIKPEIEAVIPTTEQTGTTLVRTGKDLFFKFEGRRIPIDTLEVSGGVGSVASGKGLKFSSPNYYSSTITPSSQTSPASLLGGIIQPSSGKSSSQVTQTSKTDVSKPTSSPKKSSKSDFEIISGASYSGKGGSSGVSSNLKSSPKSGSLGSGISSKPSMQPPSSYKTPQSKIDYPSLFFRYTSASKPKSKKTSQAPPSKKSSLLSRFKTKLKEEPQLFEVFGKRFGQDKLIARTTSKRQAERSLFKFLRGTLGRSGRITKGGRELEFGELDLFQNRQFRPAKKSSKRVVQRSAFSLGTSQEVSEILSSRRPKGKKRRNLFFDF